MSRKEQIPSLDTLQGGAVAEAYEHEFIKVMQNLADPNTDPDKVREIHIRIIFKPVPNSDGEVTCGSQVTSKLAPTRPVMSTMFIEQGRGILAATEFVRDKQSAQ